MNVDVQFLLAAVYWKTPYRTPCLPPGQRLLQSQTADLGFGCLPKGTSAGQMVAKEGGDVYCCTLFIQSLSVICINVGRGVTGLVKIYLKLYIFN